MKYSSIYKLFLRLLTSPIILLLLSVTYLVNTLRIFIHYILYGGEWITYDKHSAKTISDIYEKLKEEL